MNSSSSGVATLRFDAGQVPSNTVEFFSFEVRPTSYLFGS